MPATRTAHVSSDQLRQRVGDSDKMGTDGSVGSPLYRKGNGRLDRKEMQRYRQKHWPTKPEL